MSQNALAAAAGVSQSLVSEIENNEYAGSTHIVQLARAVGVNPLWLESNRGPRLATDNPAAEPLPFDAELIAALLRLPERWLGRVEQAMREIIREYEGSSIPPDDRTPPNYALLHGRGRLAGKRKLK